MEKAETFNTAYLESLHLPFSSYRYEKIMPGGSNIGLAPSYKYISGRLFTLSHGILIWYVIPPIHIVGNRSM